MWNSLWPALILRISSPVCSTSEARSKTASPGAPAGGRPALSRVELLDLAEGEKASLGSAGSRVTGARRVRGRPGGIQRRGLGRSRRNLLPNPRGGERIHRDSRSAVPIVGCFSREGLLRLHVPVSATLVCDGSRGLFGRRHRPLESITKVWKDYWSPDCCSVSSTPLSDRS